MAVLKPRPGGATDDGVGGDAGVFKDDVAGACAALAHLVVGGSDVDAGGVGGDEEGGDAT